MNRNLILNFHVVKDALWFESVILFLKSRYTLVGLDHFEDINKGKGFCHITFDDGDKTFYSIVFPIIKKHNVPITLFVSPKITLEHQNFWFQEIQGYPKNEMVRIISEEFSISPDLLERYSISSILKCLPKKSIDKIISTYQKQTDSYNKKGVNMNLNEVLEVEKSGLVVIGAHTLNHPILNNESDENSENEITKSIHQLQEILGHEVKYFAYPNGIPQIDFDQREIDCLSRNNISVAVSTESKYISNKDDLLSLPRIGISHGSIRFIKFKMMFGPYWDQLKSIIKQSEFKNRKKIKALLNKQKQYNSRN